MLSKYLIASLIGSAKASHADSGSTSSYSNCFDWNQQSWQGTAPTNPINTVCGLYTCTPCAEAVAQCFEWNQKQWNGISPSSPAYTECGLDECTICDYCFEWNNVQWSGVAPTSPQATQCGLQTCNTCALPGYAEFSQTTLLVVDHTPDGHTIDRRTSGSCIGANPALQRFGIDGSSEPMAYVTDDPNDCAALDILYYDGSPDQTDPAETYYTIGIRNLGFIGTRNEQMDSRSLSPISGYLSVSSQPMSKFKLEPHGNGVLIRQYSTYMQDNYQNTEGTYLLAHGAESFIQGADGKATAQSHLIYMAVPDGTSQWQTVWSIGGLEDSAKYLFGISASIAAILFSSI